MNGDILTMADFSKFYEFALGMDTDLTVAIKKIITPFSFGNIFYEGDYVTGIQEKPDIEMEVVAGIYVMKPEIFRLIPDGTYFGMDELIQNMLRQDIPVAKYHLKEYWLDIGQIDDFEQAQDLYNTHFKEILP